MSIDSERFPFHPMIPQDEDKDTNWDVYGSSIEDYLNEFSYGDSEHWIDNKLARLRSQQNPVVIDLLSSTHALRSLKSGLFRNTNMKGIAVGFTDQRDNSTKEQDNKNGILFVSGDLNSRKTWRELEGNVDQGSADAIIERGYGGLHYIPTNKNFYRRIFPRMWNLLNPNRGLLMLQTPPQEALSRRNVDIQSWLRKLQANQIPYQFTPSYIPDGGKHPYGLLLLMKNGRKNLPSL